MPWGGSHPRLDGMKTRLPAFGAALLALALTAPAAPAMSPVPADPPVQTAKKKKKKPARYFFVAQQTILAVTTSDCKSLTNDAHRTTETYTVERVSEQRGYLGETMTERGWNQTTLERTGNDPYLPPSRSQTPRNEFKFEDLAAGRAWKKGSTSATFNYGIIGNEYRTKLRLPKLNKELTRSYEQTYRDEKTSDRRCNYSDKVTIKGSVTLQRIQ